MRTRSQSEWAALVRTVAEAKTDDIAELIALAGLNPGLDLRRADLSGVSFAGMDLTGFDLSEARLHGCDFTGATTGAAILAEAELDRVLHSGRTEWHSPAILTGTARFGRTTDLRKAADWNHDLSLGVDSKVSLWRNYLHARHDDQRRAQIGKFSPFASATSRLRTGAIFQDAPFAPELVVVPAGQFWMGSPDGSGGDQGRMAEPGRSTDEGPRHLVTIPQGFAVGRFAVTFEEWEHYAAATGKRTPDDETWGRARRPVINVSWNDARDYAAWLSELTGQEYRLLSEAEWEYCCRSGTDTAYSFGSTIIKAQAEYGGAQTTEVGRFPSNAWGLHDMHGNVWEWCQDTYDTSYKSAPSDGSARENTGNDVSRVLRGGSWSYQPQFLRSAIRVRYRSDGRIRLSGFRLARTLNP